jgi:hypothetical protein
MNAGVANPLTRASRYYHFPPHLVSYQSIRRYAEFRVVLPTDVALLWGA